MAGISTRVSVQRTEIGFVRLSIGKRKDSLEDERGEHGAVLPTAKPHKPGPGVLYVELS